MTLTLGNFIRQILRSVECPSLSLTAYGDEGAILGALSNMLGPLAQLHGWTDGVAGAFKDDYQPFLAVPFEKVPENVIQNLVNFLEGMLAAYEPIREVQSNNDRRNLLLLTQDRLSADGAAWGAYSVGLMSRIVAAVNCRDLFEVVRGDEDWMVLHRCDLLAPLGAYIVELEPGLSTMPSSFSVPALQER